MTVIWHEITTPHDPFFSKALNLYEATFEEIVRELTEVLLRGIQLGETIRPNAFHILIGVDEQERVVALAIFNYLSRVNRGFIVYLAVHPDARSHGVGALLIQQLELLLQKDAQLAGHPTLNGLVLETEDDPDFERRSRFFQKQGFAQVPDIFYH